MNGFSASTPSITLEQFLARQDGRCPEKTTGRKSGISHSPFGWKALRGRSRLSSEKCIHISDTSTCGRPTKSERRGRELRHSRTSREEGFRPPSAASCEFRPYHPASSAARQTGPS